MAQTYRSGAAHLPRWRIIDAESWIVRGPTGPELRRAPRLRRGVLAAFRATIGRLAALGRG